MFCKKKSILYVFSFFIQEMAVRNDTVKRISEIVGSVDQNLDIESRYNARLAAFNQVIRNHQIGRKFTFPSPPRQKITRTSMTKNLSNGFVARQMDWNRRKSIAIELERHRRTQEKLDAEKRATLRVRSSLGGRVSSRNRMLTPMDTSPDIAKIMANLNRVKALLENNT